MIKKICTAITRQSLPKFIIVGTINTVVDFGILNLLVFFGYTASFIFFGQNFLIANAVSFGIAVINSFILNQVWVFNDSGQQHGKCQRIILFLAVTILSVFIIQQVLFNILYYSYIHAENGFMSLNAAKLIAATISAAINFLGYRYLVFRK